MPFHLVADYQPLLDKTGNKFVAVERDDHQRRVARHGENDSARDSIHTMMATEMPKWLLEAIDKWLRKFFWTDHLDANGGNCSVAWYDDCRPVELGGLGIKNL